jgi:N-acetylneuraminic acid mutarotase
MAVVDGKIYVISGYYAQGYTDQVQVYDPASNTWSSCASLPIPVSGAAAGATTGAAAPKRLYVMGGRNLASNKSLPGQVYDPETDTWTLGAPIPTARQGLAVAVQDDILYAVGGTSFEISQSTLYAVNEQYTPLGYENATSASPLPSPTVPEFPTLMVLPLLLAASAFVFVYRSKTKRK